ncbi:gamma-glutamyl-gamma-aminobutyrate hydrolase family protein [Streptomyces katrae]|uniref:Gamma-glutamyl-gamma-aminobutyrate hydrolase family protein n=1 Tax=Streptomyces katrae TaxID=68223 RepID=A0ABT7H5R7_9ACTN|nr:gamma-glutamyl-gamma-aminobutyrate hydrolase family protein [Streptomyces katrae]MDK9501233.1 gamma-glutamyl-gamma-aminobutyrate hydrolase family protein [Streptomyces katrae]
MPRPLIGITTYVEESTRYNVWDLPTSLVPSGYYELVQAAGGAAVLLPPDEPERAAEVLSRLDGLIVSGGPDVDPARYGAARDPRTGPPARVRDEWELALLAAALDSDLPVLGICRGMQALNVALGGTLVQHIDGHVHTPGVTSWHPVNPVAGTRYAELVPEKAEVPTYHHQAVDVVGRGLVVSAYADDGTVEAIEDPDRSRYVLGVQWHPERDKDTRVMASFVEAAGARRSVPVPVPVPVS